MRHLPLLLFAFLFSCSTPKAQKKLISPGAYQVNEYGPLLKGKNVGFFVNHTSLINNTHLIDSLQSLNINILKVFTPEHGFKGNLSDGEEIENETHQSSFELISLYGSSKKPTDEQMKGVDILIIDIQDVGVRFYTYASTMTYLMESCAKNNIPVLILDRPNPNGSYIDGPVLKKEFSSFIGLHPIPLVHGLTLGELAFMINEEGWLGGHLKCELEIIKVKNWDHGTPYSLPVKPSPNLPNDLAIALYPSLALFEGTVFSIGRGTDIPFQVIGHPYYSDTAFSFVPVPNEGSKYPPLEGERCFGIDLLTDSVRYEFNLKYLIDFYNATKDTLSEQFFNSYFEKLAGTDQLQKLIEMGVSENEIREGWKTNLESYKKMREKYLLYD